MSLPAFNRTSLESKLNFHGFSETLHVAFNRTSLESKLREFSVMVVVYLRFNRTSLESKLQKRIPGSEGFRVVSLSN